MNVEPQLPEVNIALTEYAHGAGCGCKIAPSVLQEILHSHTTLPDNKNLLVGNDTNDDAAVYLLNENMALISTTDFFTPIVDDAYLFGKIAAANAISDVYAMGGTPIMAVAILGWPVETLPASLAQKVIKGAREVCSQANIPLGGGHSIDSKEPIFGLAVNGILEPGQLKRNNTATKGDFLFLTKPIGTGILSTAQKRKVLAPEHYDEWIEQLVKLNDIGKLLGKVPGVTAMTDVTGFGLLGHLYEMATGSGLSAELHYNKVPILEWAKGYATQKITPDATFRNWNASNKEVKFEPGVNVMEAFSILPDPQTNGGLLIAVKEDALKELTHLLEDHGYVRHLQPIGRMITRQEKTIIVS